VVPSICLGYASIECSPREYWLSYFLSTTAAHLECPESQDADDLLFAESLIMLLMAVDERRTAYRELPS